MKIRNIFKNFFVLALMLFLLFLVFGFILIFFFGISMENATKIVIAPATIALGVFYAILFKEPMPRNTMLEITSCYTFTVIGFTTYSLYSIAPNWMIGLAHGMALFLSFLIYLTLGISSRLYLKLIKKNSSLLRRTFQ